MAITITGGPFPANLTDYTAVEDATPLDPNSATGGFGQITWTSEEWPLARRMLRKEVVLQDNERGRTTGTVRAVDKGQDVVTFTADSELGKFNVVRQAMPFSGPSDELIQYYMDLCGVFSPLDYQAPIKTIHAPGFYGNVWDNIKLLLSANQIEMALVADNVVVRRPGLFEATTDYLTGADTQIESQTSAIAIVVNYYNNRAISKGEVYPIKGEEPSIQSVAAGETTEWEVELNASLSTVYQPVAVLEAGPGNRSGSNGVYTVVGSDNLVIPPAQWRAAGGSLRVEITNDPSVVKFVLTGADIRHLSPFRIAESAGGHDYNSLHVTGDGVAWEVRSMLLNTGADPLQTSEEIGATVDNRFLSTPSQAYSAAQRTAAEYSGSAMKISGTAVTINRETFDRTARGATIADVNRVHGENSIVTMADFNAAYAGESLEDFDEHWRELYREEFFNQVYGNVNGARIRYDDAYFRIESATIKPDTIDYSGTLDTKIRDFNSVWAGRSMDEFNESWAEATLQDFSLTPLWEGTHDSP